MNPSSTWFIASKIASGITVVSRVIENGSEVGWQHLVSAPAHGCADTVLQGVDEDRFAEVGMGIGVVLAFRRGG
ncbi:hypothetical protein FQZ97_994940 [compost metagenome]